MSVLKFFKNFYKKQIIRKKITIVNKSSLFDNSFYLKLYPDTKDFIGGGVAHYVIHGEKEGRKPNSFFDPKWYINSYTSLNISSPLLHYIKYGESKGFKPCSSFDPAWYTKNYTINGISPLRHFLEIGLSKQFLPNKNYISEAKNKHENITPILKVAVVIHVYYLDMIPSILSRILKVSLEYKLFFTVSPERKEGLTEILNSLGIEDYELMTYSSSGYDVAPFIQLLPHLQSKNYDLVCKLHTKKGDGELGEFWFKLLIDSIFGSGQTVKNIISKFESEKKLGLVGGGEVYKSAQRLMYGNTPFIKKILSMTTLKYDLNDDWGFFAGTMFWVRLEALSPFINNKNLSELLFLESHQETTGESASTFHAIERLFGLLPRLSNLNTALSYPINLERTEHTIKTISANDYPVSPMAISMSLNSELATLNTLKLIYNNKFK